MFNIGSGELVLIAVVALLVLGPKRLPELARGIGKFLREFRRQTDEVRGVVEREFYKMDQEMDANPPAALPATAPDAIAATDGQPVPAEGAVPSGMLDDGPMDHSDPRHPDYGKDDPSLHPEEQQITHHTDPTPAQPPETAAAADPAPPPADPAAAATPAPAVPAPEKKAS